MYPQNPKKAINRILERANPFYHLFAHYNDALNNDSTAYMEKCKIIAEIWKSISKDYGQHTVQDVVQVMDWGKQHTFHVVLDGQWNHQKECFEEVILFHLKQCEQGLVKINKQFHFHFQGLIKVIQQPWDNEVLRGILQTSDRTNLTQREISYFANETGYATTMRIKKLVDAQCEDFAINLCSAYLKCLKLFEQGKVTLVVTEDHKKYAFDIYVVLLYRVKRMDTMVSLLKALTDAEAKELVGRFSSKNAVNCKVWKSSYKVIFFSSMVFLHRHTQLETQEDRQTVLDLMKAWVKAIDMGSSINDAVHALKKLLFTQDTTSVFIYTIIEGLKEVDVKQTRIELYIRALNKDLNRLETLRTVKEEKLVLTVSQELSDGLLKLAAELDDHLTVARECVLTAFSLNPTKDIFDLIEKMAVRCGLNVLDTGQWICKFHAPIDPNNTTIECQACKKHMKPISLRAFNTNTILSEALTVEYVGLPQELCDDLVIILCSPRYQLLSWLQEWNDLHRLCIMYLDNPEKTKNIITELKFVEIDYSLYQNMKREPQESSLGYDKVLESDPESAEEEFQFRKKTPKKGVIRDSSEDESDASDASNTTKSDPTVLKSLRSFRKRKSDDSPVEIPVKVVTAEPGVAAPLAQMLEWNRGPFSRLPTTQFLLPPTCPNYEPDCDMEVLDLSRSTSQNSLDTSAIIEDYDPLQEIDKILENPCTGESEKLSDVMKDLMLPVANVDHNATTTQDKSIEAPTTTVEETIVQIPKVRVDEKIVEVPKVRVDEKIVEVPKVRVDEKIVEVPKVRVDEKIVETSIVKVDEKITEPPIVKVDENIVVTPAVKVSKKIAKPPAAKVEKKKNKTVSTKSGFKIVISKRTDAIVKMDNKFIRSPKIIIQRLINDKLLLTATQSHTKSSTLRKEVPHTTATPAPSATSKDIVPRTTVIPKPSSTSMDCDLDLKVSKKSKVPHTTAVAEPMDCDLTISLNSKECNQSNETPLQESIVFVDLTKQETDAVVENKEIKTLQPNDVKDSNKVTKKSNVENSNQTAKETIDVSAIEEIIGQKIVRKGNNARQKSKPDSYIQQLLNQPRYRRLHKPSKYEDYLYELPEHPRRQQEKPISSTKNEVAQDTNEHEEDDKRNETNQNILKSDNYHTGQKLGLHQDPDVKEQTNQDRSLFRERGTEGFYTEETGKIAKKPHRESNENKENSGYISKRSNKSKIKRKPKKHCRVSKSEDKEVESDPEMEFVQIKNGVYDRLLQDVKVVIDRLNLPAGKTSFSLSTDPEIFKTCRQLNSKLPRRPFADKNQRLLGNWRCKNPEFSDASMNPKVMLKYIDINQHMENADNPFFGVNSKCDSSGKNKKKFNNNGRNAKNINHAGLRFKNSKNAKNVLANVPGMKDTELIQPPPVANVVQVVQMTGRSSNSSTTTQTSTQVTPHIQRIGQPRQDKPETSNDTTATTSAKTATNTKPAATQSSLINILSHPVIRTSTGTSTTGRAPPVINILSNQIIRPASSSRTPTTARITSAVNAAVLNQSNNVTNRTSGESQLITQLTNPSRPSTTTGGASTIKVATSSEPSRIVQFICQSSDGKLIPVSSFAQNCVVKVASSQNISPTSPSFEENFPKVVKAKSSEANVDSENAETLPKFQQAFGKSVYQSKPSGTNSTNITNNLVNHEVEKPKITVVQKGIVTATTSAAAVKPIPGGVIYTRQVQSGQTINLIPQSRGQVFRIATSNSDQISVVKDTLIQNKMNALLAAALSKKDSDDSESEKQDETTSTTRVAIARPGLVQNARIVKPVLQIPSNVIRNTPQNMSSTTLEQLREFDMVYKQVKERSSTTPASEVPTNSDTSESQCISVTYLNQGQKINCAPIVVVSSYNAIQPVSSPALNVVSQGNTSPRVTPSPSQTSTIPKVTPKASKGKTVKTPAMQNTSKASPIPKPQQKPQEDEHTTQRIFDILAEYAEQLRNSPDLNNKPAPRRRSNPPTNPSQNSKRKKSSSSKKPTQSNSTVPAEPDTEDPRTLGSEDSSCGVMQLSVPEDDQPTTLASTSESNDSTSTPRQQLILTDSSNQPRNLIIAESSVGEALKMPNTAVLVPGNYIMPVSMVKGGQQIAVVSGGSKILATVPARSGPNMLLFQSFLNQNRKSSVPTVKYSTIQPISGISSQSLTGVTAQPPVILPPLSHSISTVTLGQPITVKKLDNSGQVNTELLLTISQSRENDSSEDTPQPDSSTNVVPASIETVEIEETTTLSDNSSEKSYTPYQKPLITTPIATPVIAQTSTANTTATPPKEEALSEQSQSTTQTVMTLNITPIEQKGEQRKTEERIQTVLVTASSSNGSRSNFKDSTRVTTAQQQNKDDFLRNNDKRNNEQKNLQQSNNVYPQQGKLKKVHVATQRLDRELQQLCLQRKQAALERELRLQKSLSEECEDLGVDEPSTSDLFPEAELLFDSNHSPSFEQTSDVTKRIIVQQEGGKEEAKLTLFSDDDFLFEAGEYQKGENTAEYDGRTNGQSTETESPCEDATLLRTCTSMSDVTLNSPISPDSFHPTTPPPLHKYVHKYSNRKKSDKTMKQVDNWAGEVSSSEDTTGSNEVKSSSPEICLSKVTEEELADGSFKVVRVAIAKRECGDCSEEGDCSLSGRGARRSVKKLCSCCNGASSQDSRKRPGQPHQHVPVPQKKVFPVKKR